MERREITITIIRENQEQQEIAKLSIPELNNIEISLAEKNTNDIEAFFEIIFNKIIEDKKLITLKLDDPKKDLFYEIANDLISQINNEIIQSEKMFREILNIQDTTLE